MAVDKSIVKLLQEGSEEAFVQVYNEYAPKLYRFIYATVRHAQNAEDILQKSFLSLWEKRETIDIEKSFQAYIYTIAKHNIFNFLRQKFYISFLEDAIQNAQEKIPATDEDYLNRIIDEDIKNYIKNVIADLPPKRKEIFILSRYHNMTYKEIAAYLNISENTVDVQIRNAMAYLKNKLSRDELLLLLLFSDFFIN